MNLPLMLDQAVARFGDKTAITMGEQRVSFRQLGEESCRIAHALLKMGLKKGDRVAVMLSNSPEYVSIYFGIARAGGVAVLLDTKYKPAELSSLFHDCQPRVLFLDASLGETADAGLPDWKSVENVVLVGRQKAGAGEYTDYREMLEGSPAQTVEVAIADEDLAHIAYTSGPTYHPRGVSLSHGGLVAEAGIGAAGFRQTEDDTVVLFALPMHHAFGLVVIVLTSVFSGSRIAMLSGLSIASLMDLIERERVTMFMAVPFVYGLIVSYTREFGTEHDLSSLRICGSAGSALPLPVMEEFDRNYGLTIIDFWGQTESSGHVTCQDLDGSFTHGSVGRVLPGWQLRIVDNEDRELPVNSIGEIVVRGPIMKGYFKKPEETARAIRDGWLHTSDMGRLDERGEVFLAGLKKDMIIAKGQNIYPSDIETVLAAHPGVAEAAVVGVKDEARGQIVRAVVSLKSGETATEHELKKYCMERLANYKVPKQVVFTDSFPRDEYGKIDKSRLR